MDVTDDLVGSGVADGRYASGARVDLQVLVLTDGTPWVQAVAAELAGTGIPATVVDLTAPDRPTLDQDFLRAGAGRARFQSVVVPEQNPARLRPEENAALVDFEREFRIRRVNAFVWPNQSIGLSTPAYSGSLDGITATVTEAGRRGPFRYLMGNVRFEDNSPTVQESFGYLSTPAENLTPLVTATIPGTTDRGTLIGAHRMDGREQLILTFAYGRTHLQWRIIAAGVLTWMTRGTHLGHRRNYFSVQVDDTFATNARWSVEANCTPGHGDCPPGVKPTLPIRLTRSDVTRLAEWQEQRGFVLSQYFNARASEEFTASYGSDPVAEEFLREPGRFRWGNHTWSHLFLGCRRDFTVIPWRCATDAAGKTIWLDESTIRGEIQRNLDWAEARGLSVDPGVLLAGEHSGIRIVPQQPTDNPEFVKALTAQNITVIGADASRDPAARQVGSARTIARYPMALFVNVGTRAEMVDEYNWRYTATADGGSGACERTQPVTCIKPLDPDTGFDTHITRLEVDTDLRHITANDPRPHYVHQANLAEERLAYPVLNAILDEYEAVFTEDTPLVNPTMREAADIQRRQDRWSAVIRRGEVQAQVRDGQVTISVTGPTRAVGRESGADDPAASSSALVPITVPVGTSESGSSPAEAVFGDAYAGLRSSWRLVRTGAPLRLSLPTPAVSPQTTG